MTLVEASPNGLKHSLMEGGGGLVAEDEGGGF